ncbi:MAG: hypothetical protein M1823_001596 [Watsoniomyces obsoletus]|nr:MAG: hypothetical protein M1823_001596 [Watsoniomyces obsoletus]
MKNPKSINLLQVFVQILQSLLTASYLGAYRYYTLGPIKRIRDHQDINSRAELIKALVDFRCIKEEELSFVAKAAALSAAAVIGVFSWPTTERTVWAAKMLWNWSFFMSTFSLVGSAPTRLLQHLPNDANMTYDEQHLPNEANMKYNQRQFKIALNLFLQPSEQHGNSTDSNAANRHICRRMLWVWQCPAMLMSYSWIFFLLGYALHVLSPVFDRSQAEVSSTMAMVTIGGCALLLLNFAFCAGMCQYRLQDKGLREWVWDFLSGNEGEKKKDEDAEVKDLA